MMLINGFLGEVVGLESILNEPDGAQPGVPGREPNEIDDGPHADGESFSTRIGLATDQRSAATVYEQMVDPAMPPGRVHPGDERHLAGAFQDNRVIPFEGICVRDLSERSRELVLAFVAEYLALLPDGPRAARTRESVEHLDETWFCWIGATDPETCSTCGSSPRWS
jgi:uncharacterized protein DUF3500